MSQLDVQQAFAATFVDALAEAGVRSVCVCPGSRSAPLAMAFARHESTRVYTHIDERSGSFFALGLARATRAPVALLCTSGTAAAEFHPAVVEAFHAHVPLVVVTADRPPELRENGAGQTIDQLGIYGTATRWSFDVGVPADTPNAVDWWRRLAWRAASTAAGPPAGPVHLNISFRDPLVPAAGVVPQPSPRRSEFVASTRSPLPIPEGPGARVLAGALAAATRPLVIAGPTAAGDEALTAVVGLARAVGAPILAEPASQLRRQHVAGLVTHHDALARSPSFAATHQPDVVLRVGAPPTSKALNQAILSASPRTFVADPLGDWLDPSSVAEAFFREPVADLLAETSRLLPPRTAGGPWLQSWLDADALAAVALDGALAGCELFEGQAVRAMSATIPAGHDIVLGSSMTIRAADAFWGTSPGNRFFVNRGANGIDGLISTGMGVAAARAGRTIIVCGDLTLYHDMNGLWAARRHDLDPVVVVLDNNGGGIFSFLPQAAHTDVFDEVFGTPLDLDLSIAGRMYGMDVHVVDRADAIGPALEAALAAPRPSMVLVRFSQASSVAGHAACWAAVERAIAG